MQPATARSVPPGRVRRTESDAGISYRSLTDEQLITERARLQIQLDDLTMNPGSSPVISQVLANMEQEIERMTGELWQRSRSRHPSSGMGILRRFRSMSWPTNTG